MNYELLEKAARALVAKLDECKPHVSMAFLMAYHSRGRDYEGPNYGDEHEALRESLGMERPEEGDSPCEPHSLPSSTPTGLGR